jgi:hypothetical protein
MMSNGTEGGIVEMVEELCEGSSTSLLGKVYPEEWDMTSLKSKYSKPLLK